MKSAWRILISLVLTLILTTAFVWMAYSGMFRELENAYYAPQQIRLTTKLLESGLETLAAYHSENQAKIEELARENAILEAWRPIQERAVVETRERVVARFLVGFRGIAAVQVFDPERRRIQYSSLRGDVLTQEANRIAYRPPTTLEPRLQPQVLDPRFRGRYYDASRRSLGYVIQLRDLSNVEIGALHVLVSTDDFGQRLFERKLVPRFDAVRFFDANGFVILLSALPVEEYLPSIVEVLRKEDVPEITDLTAEGQDAVLIAFGNAEGKAAAVLPADFLRLPPLARWLSVAAFGSTVFLLFLLLTGARPDPEAVFRLRLKSLKIQILQEILRSGEDFTAEKLAGELRRNGVVWKRTLRAALGHIPKRKRQEYEELVEKSWDEILQLLEPKVMTGTVQWDTQRLERLIKESLAQMQALGANQPAARPRTTAAPVPTVRSPQAAGPAEAVAEAEPVEELEEAEPVQEAEAVAEAEPVEELEELEVYRSESGPVPVKELDPHDQPGFFLSSEAWSFLDNDTPIDELKPLDRYEELEAVEQPREESFIEQYGPVELTALYQPIEGDAFEEEEGLPVLRASAFARPRQAKDKNLAALVDQLIHDEEDFSLEDEEPQSERFWSWTPRGFDFEELLAAYPANEVGVFKAIVDLSRHFDCFAAAILSPKERNLVAEYSVGFTPKGKTQLKIPLGSALYRNYLSKGGITVMETHGLPPDFMDRLLDKRDHGIVKTLLFVPIFWNETTVYLFLVSSRRRKDWLNVLKPRIWPARHAKLWIDELEEA